jgi:hypothetical protein
MQPTINEIIDQEAASANITNPEKVDKIRTAILKTLGCDPDFLEERVGAAKIDRFRAGIQQTIISLNK